MISDENDATEKTLFQDKMVFYIKVKPHMTATWRTISIFRTANGKIASANKINPNQISQTERSACHRGWGC